MTATTKIRRSAPGTVLDPHVAQAVEDFGPEASLVEVAASAWSAEHQARAIRAAEELKKKFHRLFGKDLETCSSEMFDRQNPRECVGGTVDGMTFAFRGQGAAYVSLVVQCAHKDCPQEVFGPVNGIVELGKVLSLIEDEKVDGKWYCQQHRPKKAAQGVA